MGATSTRARTLDINMSRPYALTHMRTTVRLDDHLLATAKRRAAQRGVTLTRVIEDALRESLAREATPQSRRSRLPRLGDGELLPGVDLADSVALRDLLDYDCS